MFLVLKNKTKKEISQMLNYTQFSKFGWTQKYDHLELGVRADILLVHQDIPLMMVYSILITYLPDKVSIS